MTNFDLRIHIRLATLSLGRDPYTIKFPAGKTSLLKMLADLHAEQRVAKSGLSPEMVKAHNITDSL